MTEDEAKTKWCPFARVLGAGPAPGFANEGAFAHAAVNRGQAVSTNCIGSACMAWRWAGYRTEDGKWVRKTAGGPWEPKDADGFCGLAGAGT